MTANGAIDRLILNVADGDMSALAELYGYISAPVFSYALSVLKNRSDAEDVLHDVLVGIIRHAKSYESRGKPIAWVITMARNLCMSRLRERSRFSDAPAEEVYLPDNVSPEDRATLRACMEKLKDDERSIVVMHAAAGLKHREIAQILGLPLSTVLSKYNRSIKKLRETLNDKEYGD